MSVQIFLKWISGPEGLTLIFKAGILIESRKERQYTSRSPCPFAALFSNQDFFNRDAVFKKEKVSVLQNYTKMTNSAVGGKINATSLYILNRKFTERGVVTHHHHHHKHQGLDPLIRSVSRVTTVFDNGFSVFQLFFFLVVCSDMISKGFGLVAFFANVKTSSVCIHLSCPVCIQSLVHGVRSRLFCDHKACSLLGVSTVRTQMCYIIRYYTTYQLHVSAIT